MKRLLCGALLLIVLTAFYGCDKMDTIRDSKPDSGKLDLKEQYIRTNQIDVMAEITYNTVATASSAAELNSYFDTNKQYFDFTGAFMDFPSFEKALEKYDDAYFKDNMLALVLLQEGSGSIRHRVISAVRVGDEIAVNIEREVPEVGTSDMAEWHIILELSKADADGKTFKLEIMNKGNAE